MDQSKLIELIAKYAEKYDLEPAIVYGIVKQESAFNELAMRHEPAYKWVWKPEEAKPRWCSLETERMLQKTSFGLMQVMGAVFREYGFQGWLSQIVTSPELQLEFGCKHLGKKIKRYGKEKGIAAYNAGSPRRKSDGKLVNQYYVDNVLKYALIAAETELL